MAVQSQVGCLVDWQQEQLLALLQLHRVMGHRLQCMSAAIGPTAVHIGTDTVGSIRAFGCASKRPTLILRSLQQLRQLAMFAAVRCASFIAREASQTAIRPGGTDHEIRTLGL
jgi:hypothetical protein